MKKVFNKAMSFIQVGAMVAAISTTGLTAFATDATGTWLKGDFHTHTYLSDGMYTAPEVAAHAKQFGLDWYSACDHGGGTVGTRDQNGVAWATGTAGLVGKAMPRWATIIGIGEDAINKNRESIMQISGFEWNVPSHEHASVGMIGDSAAVKKALAVFDYTYDSTAEAYDYASGLFTGIERGMDGNTEKIVGGGTGTIAAGKAKVLTNNSHNGALAGATFLQNNYPTTSYFIPNHVSRALKFTAADFREFNDVAPDVCFGAELIPGHQAASFRGGYSQMAVKDGVTKKLVNINSSAGNTFSEKLDSYIKTEENKLATGVKSPYTAEIKAAMLKSLETNVPQQRTYGGADYLLAKVGGAYDAVLSEGRQFWIFGNSDFHIDNEKAKVTPGYEADFWPGEYTKTYTYTAGKDYQSILNGMRSGNSFTVLGDLIDSLDYKITSDTASATMGQTLTPVKGKNTVVTIKFKSPEKNNNGDKPAVEHIDLIAGEVTGIPTVKYVDSSKVNITDFTDPKQYLTAEYQKNEVSTTKVLKTFTSKDWKTDKDGYNVITFTLPATDKDMYYRLRGTNNAIGTKNVAANGDPTIDTAATTFVGDNTIPEAYSDLWFYSNPIFVGTTGEYAAANNTATTDAAAATTDSTSGNPKTQDNNNGVALVIALSVVAFTAATVLKKKNKASEVK